MGIKLSNKVKIFYGIGVSYAIVDQIFAQWVMYFYLPPESSGLSPILTPTLLAIALSISRIVDVITDPLIGYFSDRTKTKFGRRIPFIGLGIIPLVLTTAAFFYPPQTNEGITFLYLTVVGGMFFTFYTIVGGPYNSLIPEIGKNSEERLSLSTWQSIFRLIYSAIAMILPGIIIKYFGDGNTIKGIRVMVLILCVITLVGASFTIFGVDEKKYSENKTSEIKFIPTVKILLKDKPFIYYLFGLLFFFIGFNTLRSVTNYYVEDIMGYSKAGITLASGILFGMSALFFYPTVKLSKKYGYRKVVLGNLIFLIVLTLSMFFVGKTISPKGGFVLFGLIGAGIAGGAFIFPPAMLSEIGTKISLEHKENIQGICFGIQGFFLKTAFLVTVSVVPFLLTYSNNGMVGKKGIYLTTVFSAASFLVSFLFYYNYKDVKLNEK